MLQRWRICQVKSLALLKRFSIGYDSRMAKKRKNPAAVALGRLGGKACAKVRNEKLSPERRSEIAKKAALARWQTKPES